MTRTLIVAPKSAQRAAIETLYDLRSAHIVDYNDRDEPAYEGFSIGEPLPEGSEASERLVRLRALKRQLDLEDHEPSTKVPVSRIEEELDRTLVQVETDVQNAVESRDRVESALDDVESRMGAIEPFTDLPLDFEDYRGYDSLEVFAGRCDRPVDDALSGVGARYETFAGGDLVAVFAEADGDDEVESALIDAGFQDVPIPDEEGSPEAVAPELRRERKRLEDRLESARDELEELRTRYGDFLVAAEEHLTIEVEKAEAPLDFASSENAFVVDAWIPRSELENVERSLEAVADGPVHLEPVAVAEPHHEHGDRDHGHDDEHHEDEHVDEEEHLEETPQEEDSPPTEYKNPAGIRAFEPFTDLFSRPRYDELDPTLSLALAFPFFYGIMIGDLGFGVLMMVLGGVLATKLEGRDTARALGIAFLVAGFVAALSGGILFHEAFGIPFQAHHEVGTCGELHAGGETTWQCLFADSQANAVVGHPPLEKLGQVTELLLYSVLAAFIHLNAGLLTGFFNELPHDRSHAVAQIAWIGVVTGIVAQIAYMGQDLRVGGWMWSFFKPLEAAVGVSAIELSGIRLAPSLLGFAGVGAVVIGITEGGVGLIEMPSMLANILSYTRLAGIAVGKAAMAVAFNGIILVDLVILGGGAAMVAGFLFLILSQAALFALGLLSGGIQAIRLNYVEHFRWFYDGGGLAFDPFGRQRSHSTD
jgi:V/A-type H+-transporting ATPase subunit I